MDAVLAIAVIICIIAFVIFIIRIPIIIAQNRGITGSELTTISILSWVSLLIGLTWFIALILALVWQPNKWVDKEKDAKNDLLFSNSAKLSNLEMLEKLASLKEKGAISEQEFQEGKAKLMNKI